MQLEGLAVTLRPRPMAEAADLGVLLVQTYARSVWRVYAPVWAAVVLVALSTAEITPWLPALVVFWLKPWLDRSLLFVLSRAVFGEATHFADLWRQRKAVWWTQWPSSLSLRRLSPWRSYVQAVDQLEGQRGKARRRRCAQLLQGKRGAALGVQWVFASAETVLVLGALAIIVWVTPAGSGSNLVEWFSSNQQGVVVALLLAAVQSVMVLLLEPFFVAAGFLMYLNRRVELEAWDIEQEFRRAFPR